MNDDMVVNPPQKPVASNKRISVDSTCELAPMPAITPINRQPMIFDSSVPNGRLSAA